MWPLSGAVAATLEPEALDSQCSPEGVGVAGRGAALGSRGSSWTGRKPGGQQQRQNRNQWPLGSVWKQKTSLMSKVKKNEMKHMKIKSNGYCGAEGMNSCRVSTVQAKN